MPSHSPSAEQCRGVAFVSGPRTVSVVLPYCLVTTISQWLAAIELKEPARSLWARQILSTNGESDGLSSKLKIILLPPSTRLYDFIDRWLHVRNQFEIP